MSETTVSYKVPALLVIFIASNVLWIHSVDICSTFGSLCGDVKYLGFAIAVGLVGASLSSCWMLLVMAKSPLLAKADVWFAAVQLIWWAFGVSFCTSLSGPYSAPDNGYFSVWAGFIAAFYYCLTVPGAKRFTEGRDSGNGLIIVTVASLIELLVSIDYDASIYNTSSGFLRVWAVLAGSVSLCGCCFQLFLLFRWSESAGKVERMLSIFLVLWWGLTAILLTSAHGPFMTMGAANGYISTWVGFGSSVMYLYNSQEGVKTNVDGLYARFTVVDVDEYGQLEGGQDDIESKGSSADVEGFGAADGLTVNERALGDDYAPTDVQPADTTPAANDAPVAATGDSYQTQDANYTEY